VNLPVITRPLVVTDADVVRLFYKCELEWTRQLGDETTLDIGSAFASAPFSTVAEANRVFDVAMSPGQTPENVLAIIDEHYTSLGLRCLSYVPNVSASAHQNAPWIELLESRGGLRRRKQVLRLDAYTSRNVGPIANLKIIPARAAYAKARQLATDAVRHLDGPQWLEAGMAPLDNPQYDMQLALDGTWAVARVGALTIGEIGLIRQLYVVDDARRQELTETMMDRAIESCSRSLFRHVLVSCDSFDVREREFYLELGFRIVGEFEEWRYPET